MSVQQRGGAILPAILAERELFVHTPAGADPKLYIGPTGGGIPLAVAGGGGIAYVFSGVVEAPSLSGAFAIPEVKVSSLVVAGVEFYNSLVPTVAYVQSPFGDGTEGTITVDSTVDANGLYTPRVTFTQGATTHVVSAPWPGIPDGEPVVITVCLRTVSGPVVGGGASGATLQKLVVAFDEVGAISLGEHPAQITAPPTTMAEVPSLMEFGFAPGSGFDDGAFTASAMGNSAATGLATSGAGGAFGSTVLLMPFDVHGLTDTTITVYVAIA